MVRFTHIPVYIYTYTHIYWKVSKSPSSYYWNKSKCTDTLDGWFGQAPLILIQCAWSVFYSLSNQFYKIKWFKTFQDLVKLTLNPEVLSNTDIIVKFMIHDLVDILEKWYRNKIKFSVMCPKRWNKTWHGHAKCIYWS